LITFYEVSRRDFTALEKEVAITLHSGDRIARHVRVINENPDLFDRVKRAWALWMPANPSAPSQNKRAPPHNNTVAAHNSTVAAHNSTVAAQNPTVSAHWPTL
jgi:hypothetical protein